MALKVFGTAYIGKELFARDTINIRETASTSAKVLKKAQWKDSLGKALAYSDQPDGTWFQVHVGYSGPTWIKGWVRNDVVTLTKGEKMPTTPAPNPSNNTSTSDESGIRKDFHKMLDMDKQTFKNLTLFLAMYEPVYKTWQSLPAGQAKKAMEAKYSPLIVRFNKIWKSYHARQSDIKNNSTYKLGNSIVEWSNAAISKIKSWVSSVGLFGLGVAPLALPAVYVGGAVIALSVITYFVYKHLNPSQLDSDEATKLVSNLYALDPEMGKKAADKLASMYVEAGDGSNTFGNKAGSGVNTFLTIAGVAGLLGVVAYVGNEAGWFDEVKSRTKKRRK